MPRSARDVTWSRALVVLARNDASQNEMFRPTSAGWEPPVDVLETKAGIQIVVALPGVRRAEIEVQLSRGELLVRATRRWLALQQSTRVHRVEVPHGQFERRLSLPSGNYQIVAEDYTDGCLLLTLQRLD